MLIYTYGKAGSTSLEKLFGEQIIGKRFPFLDAPDINISTHRVGKTHKLNIAQTFVKHQRSDSIIWLIVPVRNYFEFLISAFFQNLKHDRYNTCTINLVKEFNMSLYAQPIFPGIISTFTDVTHIPFPISSIKFDQIHHEFYIALNRFRILVLRLEDSEFWSENIFKNVGITIDTNQKSNVGTEKAYASKYREFKKMFRFPVEYVRKSWTVNQDLKQLYMNVH